MVKLYTKLLIEIFVNMIDHGSGCEYDPKKQCH